MKKLFSVLLTALMFFGISLMSFANEDKDVKIRHIVYGENETYYINPDGTKKIKGVVKKDVKNGRIISKGYFPAKYDRRDYYPYKEAQAQQFGTCWAYAAMSGLEASAMMLGGNNVDFSEAHLAYFTLTPQSEGYNVGKAYNPYTSGANQYFATYSLANLQGIAKASDYPMPSSSSSKFSEDGRFDRGSGYVIDEAVELTSTNEIKDWLMNDGEVFINFKVKSGYYKKNEDYSAFMFYNSEKTSSHAVSIIGWDDTIPASAFTGREQPENDGAWIAKHTDSSGGYYIYISFDQFLNGSTGFKSREDNWDNHYTYSTNGYSANVGTNSNYTEGASIYKAENDEKIDAVSFIVDTADEIVSGSVSVKVYTGLTDYSSPTAGTLVDCGSIKIDKDGYYTYELPKLVDIKKDELFSVCVAIGTSYNVPVWQCVEQDWDKNETYITHGNSFYRDSATAAFKRMETDDGLHDAFLHVYTVEKEYDKEYPAYLKVDGKLWKTVKYKSGQKSISVKPPEKVGYDVKWESYSLTDGGVTINAVYTPITYTAYFMADGVEIEKKNFTIEDTSISVPQVPTKTGYTGEWSDFSIAAGDLTINAVYTPITYTAYFMADGVEIEKKNFTIEDTSISVPQVPTKTGYTGEWSDFSIAAGDLTINAVYKKLSSIEIIGIETNKNRELKYKSTITFRAEYKPSESTFIKWFVKTSGKTEVYTVTNLTLSEVKEDFTVYCQLFSEDGNLLDTSSEEFVTVKNGFFDKIASFFGRLFKKNEYIITQ